MYASSPRAVRLAARRFLPVVLGCAIWILGRLPSSGDSGLNCPSLQDAHDLFDVLRRDYVDQNSLTVCAENGAVMRSNCFTQTGAATEDIATHADVEMAPL